MQVGGALPQHLGRRANSRPARGQDGWGHDLDYDGQVAVGPDVLAIAPGYCHILIG
jgi:hypothetical protein